MCTFIFRGVNIEVRSRKVIRGSRNHFRALTELKFYVVQVSV